MGLGPPTRKRLDSDMLITLLPRRSHLTARVCLTKGLPAVATVAGRWRRALRAPLRRVAIRSGERSYRGQPPPGLRRAFRLGVLMIRSFAMVGLWLCLGSVCAAGGGPENVLLVANRRSVDSLTIANHYIQLRHIPPGNVLTLEWDPKVGRTDVDTFRRQILLPVLKAIQDRGLAGQIDYVVYSCDLPWAVNVQTDIDRYLKSGRTGASGAQRPATPSGAPATSADDRSSSGSTPPKPTWPKQLTPWASTNGLTYLGQAVMTGLPVYMDLESNSYYRRPDPDNRIVSTFGFHSSYQFGRRGELLSAGQPGRRYLLSTMLGVTYGRGNTVAEILGYLHRSAGADGTHPRGTIYFMRNSNIRSKAREAMIVPAARMLQQLGLTARILEGTIPAQCNDVQGAVVGTASFDWKKARSTILPGAICEHFTSYGGDLRPNASQTPLSEWLRYGAAGSSGTVYEPYAIALKFPSPLIQVHYARGCTLAEAFYQSVSGPYQLLIVGDPLCRPWANIPRVEVEGVADGATVEGKLQLHPSARFAKEAEASHFELFVDGRRTERCAAGEPLELDTRRLADGYHELRVVAIQSGPIQSQGRAILGVTTANHGAKIDASLASGTNTQPGEPLVVQATAPGSIGIAVLHNSHLVGRITGPSGELQIDPDRLGNGPVRLRVVGLGKGDPLSYVWAKPLAATVGSRAGG